MGDPDPFRSAPEDTHTEMMRATYDALRTHGYADLTVQRIGDEFAKSKSLIYQYYDGKDDLLVGLLEFLLERFEASVPDREYEDAHEQLLDLLDHALPESVHSERHEFASAMTELRAQAPHDAAYREQFTRTDRFVHDSIAGIVREGVDEGVFRDVDPDEVASFVLTTIHGARNRRVTTDDAVVGAVRRELTEYVRVRLLVEE